MGPDAKAQRKGKTFKFQGKTKSMKSKLNAFLEEFHIRVINVRAPKIQENWVFRPFFPILQGKKI